ncbi:hypothetical protein ANPL_03005 [Anaplasma platys]|uniref:Uncharacterized protein n=2 Tax=Anaplasma platys TaxID=949 RepID=A0A858PYK9_9RICK|nr:hypothetical protein ANPL_03005 [Anaplasma platys]
MEKLSPDSIKAVINSVVETLNAICAAKPSQLRNETIRSTVTSVRKLLADSLENLNLYEDFDPQPFGGLLLDAAISLFSCLDFSSSSVDSIATQIESAIVDLCCIAKAVNLLHKDVEVEPPHRAALLTFSAHGTFDGVTHLGCLWSFTNALLSLAGALKDGDQDKHKITRLALSTATLSGLLYGGTAVGKSRKLSPPLKKISRAALSLVDAVKQSVLINASRALSPKLEKQLWHVEYICMFTRRIVDSMQSETLRLRGVTQPNLIKFFLYDFVHTLDTLCHCAVKAYGYLPSDWSKPIDKALGHFTHVEQALAKTKINEEKLHKCVVEKTAKALKELQTLNGRMAESSTSISPLPKFLISRAVDSCTSASSNSTISTPSVTEESTKKGISNLLKKFNKRASVAIPRVSSPIAPSHLYLDSSTFSTSNLSTEQLGEAIHNVRTDLQKVCSVDSMSPNKQVVDSVNLELFYLLKHVLAFGTNLDLHNVEQKLTQTILSLSECILGNTKIDSYSHVIECAVSDLCKGLKTIQQKTSQLNCARDASPQGTYPVVVSRLALSEVARALLFMSGQSNENVKEILLEHSVLIALLSGILGDNQDPQHRMAIEDMLIKEVESARNIVAEMDVNTEYLTGDDVFSTVVDKELAHHLFSNALAAINPTKYANSSDSVLRSHMLKTALMNTISAMKAVEELRETTQGIGTKAKDVKNILHGLHKFTEEISNTSSNPSKSARNAKKLYKSLSSLAAKTTDHVTAHPLVKEAALNCQNLYFTTITESKFVSAKQYVKVVPMLDKPGYSAETPNSKAFKNAYKEELKNAAGYREVANHAGTSHRSKVYT